VEAISRHEAREQVRRVLTSKRFAKARKRSRFLEFVCEQVLAGSGEKLSEYVIGLEVYERGADFDPQADAIVRVQACEIRKALRDYFGDEGKGDPLRIDLPAGHYVPVFSRAADTPEREPVGRVAEQAGGRWPLRSAAVVGLAMTCIILAGLLWRERTGRRGSLWGGAALPEAAEWFWKPFLPPAKSPLIMIPVHPLLRATHPGDSAAIRERGHLIAKAELPEFRDTMHFRELEQFSFVANTTDFTAVGEAVGLLNFFELFASAGQRVQLKAARQVDYEAIKQGNAILLGGNQTWSGRVFVFPDGFWFHGGVITNKSPRAREQAVYQPEFDPVTNSLRRDYALVLMLPNENPQQRILLIYGIYTQGSQAAIEYITNPQHLQDLRGELTAIAPGRKSPPKFFQVLLTTTVENYVPGRVSFVSARALPE
jgi:hypothetical protein